MYTRDDIQVKYGTQITGGQYAHLEARTTANPHWHDQRDVGRRRVFLVGRLERIGEWLRRVEQVRLQMVADWNAITEAESGGDPEDFEVELDAIPIPDLTTSEVEALRAIGAL